MKFSKFYRPLKNDQIIALNQSMIQTEFEFELFEIIISELKKSPFVLKTGVLCRKFKPNLFY